MFKPGEILICVEDYLLDPNSDVVMTKYQTCIFKEYYEKYSYVCKYSTVIINNKKWTYCSKSFISLKEHRKKKLQKLSICQNLK